MKLMDETEKQKTTTTRTTKTKKDRKGVGETEAVVKGWQLNDFVVHLKLRFLQSIWKACLTFKSNLELALSVILKQRELYESNHVAMECRCLKT